MNIVEAYMKFNGQLVILISGLSGCGKNALAKSISKDFSVPLISRNDYRKEDYDNKFTLKNGKEIINWHTDESVDWDKMNKEVNELKKSGIVVTGFGFPQNKLDFRPDFHFHVAISKQNCLAKRKQYLEKHKDKYPEEYEEFESGQTKLKLNQLTIPYYQETVKKSVITKFINSNDKTEDEVYDEAFEGVISKIQEFLKDYNKKQSSKHQQRKMSRENPQVQQVKEDGDQKKKESIMKYLQNNDLLTRKAAEQRKQLVYEMSPNEPEPEPFYGDDSSDYGDSSSDYRISKHPHERFKNDMIPKSIYRL